MSNTIPWIKLSIAFVVCIAIRLLPPPFRAPNVEPLFATMMPFAKHGGALLGFAFTFVSMVLFDVVSGHVGSWTLLTATTYGLVGAAAPAFFKYIPGVRGYVSYAFLGTIFFDVVTGVIGGPLLFGQPFAVALAGQIPFTMMHLVGNMTFALTLSPLLEMWIVKSAAQAPSTKLSTYSVQA